MLITIQLTRTERDSSCKYLNYGTVQCLLAATAWNSVQWSDSGKLKSSSHKPRELICSPDRNSHVLVSRFQDDMELPQRFHLSKPAEDLSAVPDTINSFRKLSSINLDLRVGTKVNQRASEIVCSTIRDAKRDRC